MTAPSSVLPIPTSSRRHHGRLTLGLVLVALTALVLAGCSNETIGGQGGGQISVSPDPISFSTVTVGDEQTQTVEIRNLGEQTLTIFSWELVPRTGASVDDLQVDGLPQGEFTIEADGQLAFEVTYAPTAGRTTLGEFVFVSSDPTTSADDPTRVPVQTLVSRPELYADPDPLRFARARPGNRTSKTITVTNIGDAPLTILEAPSYSGGSDFRLQAIGRSFPLTLEVYDQSQAAANPGDYLLELEVVYAPTGEGGDTGQVLIVSNDVDSPDEEQATRAIEVLANADAPCIDVDRTLRNFGQTPVGTVGRDIVKVSNCGQQPLEVTGFKITENSEDDEFEIEHGGRDIDGDGELDETLVLDPGEEADVELLYTPLQQGTDRGKITIRSNDPVQGTLVLDMVGRGAIGQCPTATALAAVLLEDGPSVPRPSLTAVPLQYILLDGSQSQDPDGEIVRYEWSVVSGPTGTSLKEYDQAPGDDSRRVVRLLTASQPDDPYIFELKVEDNQGFTNCQPARVQVTAVPNEKIHIELLWTNPLDDDETDDLGSDVDLHLVKMGPGHWYQKPYDVYFDNPVGLWDPETPSLDIDDTNGAGPENIQMNDPAACAWYAVGVDYYKQTFGTAYATVRIYINSQLVFEIPNKTLEQAKQFWDVARIHWDGNQARVIPVDTLGDISPQGVAPAVTASMSNSGLCTDVPLY